MGLFKSRVKYEAATSGDLVDAETMPYLLFNRAILDKALKDYLSYDEEFRDEVAIWLNPTNPDYLACCEQAILDPKVVINIFKMIDNEDGEEESTPDDDIPTIN